MAAWVGGMAFVLYALGRRRGPGDGEDGARKAGGEREETTRLNALCDGRSAMPFHGVVRDET